MTLSTPNGAGHEPDSRPIPGEATHRTIEPSVLYLGTPVYLIATSNPSGTINLAPASSHFALGRTIVLGLEEGGQSLENARRHPELTVNFPAASQWAHVERLARVTGKDPVPAPKRASYRFEPAKFELAGFTEAPSESVTVPRVAEVPLQLEARVRRITDSLDGAFGMVEADVVRVHAAEEITVPGTHHIDPEAWHPLLYTYRHFYDRGPEVGWTWKTPLVDTPAEIVRWESFGGTWAITAVHPDEASVSLARCDGGETVETLTSRDPQFIRWATVQLAIGARADL